MSKHELVSDHDEESSGAYVEARPAKVARRSAPTAASLPVPSLLALTPTGLADASTDQLIQYVTDLQAAYRKLQASKAAPTAKSAASGSSSTTNAAPEDPKAVQAKAAKMADMMASGIMKQMKWQPSCKTKGKRWAYDSFVPPSAVFYKMFNMEEPTKAWKQKKIPLEEFERITGPLYASIRYGSLRITSADVTVKWDKEANSFTVSGLYGL